jgi:uncharacterized protein
MAAAASHGGGKPWTFSADGLVVTVRLTAKGGRDAIEGVMRLADGRSALKARVRAAASSGQANKALGRLIARTLEIAPGDVALVGGATSRLKRLLIRGDTGAAVGVLERVEKGGA